MKAETNLTELVNLYSLQKTLRFELIPQGKTLENIEKNGILTQDNQRADDYEKVKKLIDEYHKHHIEISLDDCRLEGLEEYKELYEKKDDLKKIQENLRKQIVKSLTENERYKDKRLFSDKLFKEDLPNYLKDREQDKALVKKFEKFTTYFTGFNENRKNMYSSEDKPTSIAYRLIHENLPKFIDNLHIFDKIKETTIKDDFDKIVEKLNKHLKIHIKSFDEIFSIEYFNKTLSQKQIDNYNNIIGGMSFENGTKIQGLNEYINRYNQKQEDKHQKLPCVKTLYKQILSDREKISWIPEQFDDDKQMAESISNLYNEMLPIIKDDLLPLMANIGDYDLSKIFISNDSALTTISQRIFGAYNVYTLAIIEKLKSDKPKSKRQSESKYLDEIDKNFKNMKSFSIAKLNNAVKGKYDKTIENYIKVFGAFDEEENLLQRLETAYNEAEPILNNIEDRCKNINQDKDAVEKIKTLLDALKDIQHFAKLLLCDNDETEIDAEFYNKLHDIWVKLDKITPIYNMVRNYVTKKPYSEEKIKLNFEKSTLLGGWDLNKEKNNLSVILRKDNLYYLGIMKKDNNKIFDSTNIKTDGVCFEKMEYKLLPDPKKMLPKVFFSKKCSKDFNPNDKILEIKENESFKKTSSNFNIEQCRKLIDFYKESINKHKDWQKFNFQFSDTKTYNDINEFYNEVEKQGYKISFCKISEDYINELVKDNKLYLFKIWNKDFSKYSKGTPNTHTLYWKQIFAPENINNVVYKLNGQAEIFFRQASISQKNVIKHLANKPVKNKNIQNEKKESTFSYDLVKDKRFTMDKFHFHVPITINFKAKGINNTNPIVNNLIRQNKIEHIIGIDRGERHLLYLSLIDLKGNIIEQKSLNEIINNYNGNEYKTDYHTLLDDKEKERKDARLSWNTIENIKELKDGYMSQVVHIISQMIVKYNAIVVLEDLNHGFVRGRQKIEKQVYEKFEHKLIDKLNYYVDKNADSNAVGGLYNALQLTNPFDSFEKLGKQSGCLFYIPAWKTSKIDPVTGFINMFTNLKYESVEKSKKFFSKFDDIRYNKEKNRFEFDVSFDKFDSDFVRITQESKLHWTLCSVGQRIELVKENNGYKPNEINLTDAFKSVFNTNKIEINTAKLNREIGKINDTAFFKELMRLMKLLLQMRNSKPNSIEKNDDYIISPVADENGVFFDSSKVEDNGNLPKDADANGAYNIARKGLYVIHQIKQSEDDKKIDFKDFNPRWLKFIQQKLYLND